MLYAELRDMPADQLAAALDAAGETYQAGALRDTHEMFLTGPFVDPVGRELLRRAKERAIERLSEDEPPWWAAKVAAWDAEQAALNELDAPAAPA